MGSNRDTIDHSKFPRMAVIRDYHQESHSIGQEAFNKKYGVYGVYTQYWKHEDLDFIKWDEDLEKYESE